MEKPPELKDAFLLHQHGRLAEAASVYEQLIKQNPTNLDALHFLGTIKASFGQLAEARELIERSLAGKRTNISFIENYAAILFQLGDFESAFEECAKGLALDERSKSLLYIRAVSLFRLQRREEALAQFDSLLKVYPDDLAGNNEKASVLAALERPEEALLYVEKAIRINGQYPEALLNKASLLAKLKRYRESIEWFDKALLLNRGLPEGHSGHGNVLRRLKRYDEALEAYDKALALNPDLAEAWLGRGNVFYELARYKEALAAYDKALALKPGLAQASLGRGNVFNELGQHADAAQAYARVLESEPNYPFAKGRLLHQKMIICDWRQIKDLVEDIERDIASNRLSAEPFGWQGVARSEKSLQQCARLYNETEFSTYIEQVKQKPAANTSKIRVGYLSGEFRDQATSHLLVGILEYHDDTQFEIYAFDNGWDDQSEVRRRINGSVHNILDISQLGDPSAIAAIRDNKIDILTNLNGYFGKHRTQVFAQRPAPVQVNYLGFPGTLGARYMDYIVADRSVIPEDHKPFYTEKVVYLPNCYQANDRKKKIASHIPARQECGLPENGFVFCCFNNSYKISPELFDRWMRILLKIDGSVLWLIEDNQSAVVNLKNEARARGVDPKRLVFATRIPLSDHLARHRLADLFLDTLPYNAHTTASDALWAGLPVLTLVGQTFAGRVAASLLKAIDLPQLITQTPDEYERMAIELAGNPEKLSAIKSQLANNRLATPLFDTGLFTRHIEKAYAAMYERHRMGLPPDDIDVPHA